MLPPTELLYSWYVADPAATGPQLFSTAGHVLDGSTFAVGWFRDGRLETPSSEALGLLPSCTLALALRAAADSGALHSSFPLRSACGCCDCDDRAGGAGMEVVEGEFELERLLGADEVFVASSTRDVMAITAVGDKHFPAGQSLCTRAPPTPQLFIHHTHPCTPSIPGPI